MAYTKNTWIDQDVERPKTYEVTNNQDGSITLTDSFGLVQELGTPVNAVNMNHIEDGIDGCAIRKHNLTETFALGEWVLGGSGDDEGFYKSLIANNVGNAVTDDTKWEKDKVATDLNGKADTDLTNTTDTGNIKMAGASMPSNKYIDLTLGASGSYYKAPANGWFCFQKVASASGQYIQLHNTTSHFVVFSNSSGAYGQAIIIPCKKGDNIDASYTTAGNTLVFRFVYAVGSESEAQ